MQLCPAVSTTTDLHDGSPTSLNQVGEVRPMLNQGGRTRTIPSPGSAHPPDYKRRVSSPPVPCLQASLTHHLWLATPPALSEGTVPMDGAGGR